MSFVATIKPTAPSEQDPAIGLVAADGWYPAISLPEMRSSMRLSDAVTTQRLRDAIVAAMIEARKALAAWKLVHVANDVARLEDIPADLVNGESELVHSWRAAVYGYAAANLAETHRDISATNEGAAPADERAIPAEQHRRNALWAIRDMLGKRRNRVRLV